MARIGTMSRRHRGRPLNAEVNIINLVDVMLVLLIIFIVTAPILQGGIKVDLPKINEPPPQLKEPIIISVGANGVRAIGAQRYTASAFAKALGILAGQHKTSAVIVQGDAAAPFADVARVLDQVMKAGITTVSLATQPSPETP